MTQVINLFAGPGCGKSSVAADLFATMKWQGMSVELVNEAAKEMTWEGHHNLLADQLYVSAMQNRKLQRLVGQVDYIITDSPLLLCCVYAESYFPSFQQTMHDIWNSYDNINFRLIRQKAYVPVGRSQNEEQAREIDDRVKNLLESNAIPHEVIAGDPDAKFKIMDFIMDYVLPYDSTS